MPAGLIYGLDKTEKSVSRIIIPYNSGKPAKGSRFSDVLLTSTLTVLQALRDGFSQDELNHIVLSHLEECKEYMRDHIENKPGGQLIDIIDPDEFDSFMMEYTPLNELLLNKNLVHYIKRSHQTQKASIIKKFCGTSSRAKFYQKLITTQAKSKHLGQVLPKALAFQAPHISRQDLSTIHALQRKKLMDRQFINCKI